ncbi:MAG: hypothetical protein RLZZ399_2644 [Verrucomicrobiota bacterium]
MAPVCGRPFVDWVVRFLAKQGVHDVVLSTGYLGNKIETYFLEQPVQGVQVRCASEAEPMGTAGGFLNAVQRFGTDGQNLPWLVVNGDSLAVTPLQAMEACLERPGVEAVILGLRVEDASRYGTLTVGEDGSLLRFAEKQPGGGIVNAGVYLFGSQALQGFPQKRPLSFETEVFPVLVEKIRVQVVTVEASFLDIGTPASLVQAESFIAAHQSFFEL